MAAGALIGMLAGMRMSRSLVAAAVAGGLLLAACGGSENAAQPEASVATVETPDTEAPAPTVPDTTVAQASTTVAPTVPVTAEPAKSFSGDVLPILQDNCASCHVAGGPGAVHLPMNTAGEIAEAATFIGLVTKGRYMPPWPASEDGLAFHDSRRLSDAQIQSVVDWVDSGAVLDTPAETTITPTRQAYTPIEADVTMTGEPYRGSLELDDDYRCRILDPQLTETSYLQGLEFLSDQDPVVHHALIFASTADARAAAETSDANDPGVGFNCSNFVNFDAGQTTLINSWAPGQAPLAFPSDTGFEMGPGDFFVVQVHYHYSKKTIDLPPDQSTLVADFASDEVIAAAGGTLDPLKLSLYLPPAEIPCTAGIEGPLCDRVAAAFGNLGVDALGVDPSDPEVGAEVAAGLDGWLESCGMTAAEVAAMTDGKAYSRCELPAEPGEIVSLWGHMHSLGSTFRMTLNPGRANERVLLDIPKWDYAWQLLYFPTEKVVLAEGDTLLVECSWDRSLDEHGKEPRYIFWAEGTFDEMCYSQVVTRPAE
jgi:mono/diheme cytochrome c family protein